jgi:hypothetical protein
VPESIHNLLSATHVAGGVFAFVAATLALLATKGSRAHLLAGRCFVLGMAFAAIPGVLLALSIGDNFGLLLYGLLALYLAATGFLAPRIARGSRAGYRVDRAVTVAGAFVSIGLIAEGARHFSITAPPSDITFGALGLWIAVRHLRWRGAADPARWRSEHLASLLSAYAIASAFILAQFVPVFPLRAHVLLPFAAVVAILWAQRRFAVHLTARVQ